MHVLDRRALSVYDTGQQAQSAAHTLLEQAAHRLRLSRARIELMFEAAHFELHGDSARAAVLRDFLHDPEIVQ